MAYITWPLVHTPQGSRRTERSSSIFHHQWRFPPVLSKPTRGKYCGWIISKLNKRKLRIILKIIIYIKWTYILYKSIILWICLHLQDRFWIEIQTLGWLTVDFLITWCCYQWFLKHLSSSGDFINFFKAVSYVNLKLPQLRSKQCIPIPGTRAGLHLFSQQYYF